MQEAHCVVGQGWWLPASVKSGQAQTTLEWKGMLIVFLSKEMKGKLKPHLFSGN